MNRFFRLFILFCFIPCFAQNGILQIESSVPAGVWIKTQAMGTTPFKMEQHSGWTSFVLRADGYWSAVSLAEVKSGYEIAFKVDMKPLPKNVHLQSAIQGDINKISKLSELENIYDRLSKLQAEVRSDSACLADFAASYPPPYSPPAGLNEASPEYREYYSLYDAERNAVYQEWMANCMNAFERAKTQVMNRIKHLGAFPIRGWIPVVSAKFESRRDDNKRGRLELYLKTPDSRADVFWVGDWIGSLGGDSLVKDLINDIPNALVFMSVQNTAVWIPVDTENGGGYVRRFYIYKNLEISWNGAVYSLDGEFILPEYIGVQPLVAHYLSTLKPQNIRAAIDTVKKKMPSNTKYVLVSSKEPFNINSTPITQLLYKDQCDKKKKFKPFEGDGLPAHSVTWQEAGDCCKVLGGRLPTEEEWIFAASAGTMKDPEWLNTSKVADYAVFGKKNGPEPVAQRFPNDISIYDMMGNVSEWVSNSAGLFGKSKLLKGGSWKSSQKALSVTESEKEDMRYWGTHVGFRCAYPVQKSANTKKDGEK